jgi:hypothetical protein
MGLGQASRQAPACKPTAIPSRVQRHGIGHARSGQDSLAGGSLAIELDAHGVQEAVLGLLGFHDLDLLAVPSARAESWSRHQGALGQGRPNAAGTAPPQQVTTTVTGPQSPRRGMAWL